MISGTGVDIVKIERFLGKINNRKFMEKIFSDNEQAYLLRRSSATMAGLFAAKEAVSKAMGTGFRGFSPCDIEITHDELGKPQATLLGAAKEKAADAAIFHISISHSDTDAIAFAVMEA